jgi:hypothetical protein
VVRASATFDFSMALSETPLAMSADAKSPDARSAAMRHPAASWTASFGEPFAFPDALCELEAAVGEDTSRHRPDDVLRRRQGEPKVGREGIRPEPRVELRHQEHGAQIGNRPLCGHDRRCTGPQQRADDACRLVTLSNGLEPGTARAEHDDDAVQRQLREPSDRVELPNRRPSHRDARQLVGIRSSEQQAAAVRPCAIEAAVTCKVE